MPFLLTSNQIHKLCFLYLFYSFIKVPNLSHLVLIIRLLQVCAGKDQNQLPWMRQIARLRWLFWEVLLRTQFWCRTHYLQLLYPVFHRPLLLWVLINLPLWIHPIVLQRVGNHLQICLLWRKRPIKACCGPVKHCQDCMLLEAVILKMIWRSFLHL